MISHAWTVVCEKSIIDEDTKSLSIDVLEEIQFVDDVSRSAGTGILLPIPVTVISLWYRTMPEQPAHSQARIILLAPDKSMIGRFETEIDLSTYERLRSRAILQALPVQSPGRHYFRVELLENEVWREIALVPLEVKMLPPGTPLAGTQILAQLFIHPSSPGSATP